MAELPKASLWVIYARVGPRVWVYGPYRKGTAMKYQAIWREKYGRNFECRMVRLSRFEDLPEGVKALRKGYRRKNYGE